MCYILEGCKQRNAATVQTCNKLSYGTNLQQVNVLTRVLACDTHTSTQIYLTREQPRKTTHAIHEVHMSPHTILKSISRMFKFNDIIMYMAIDYCHAFRIIGNDHI